MSGRLTGKAALVTGASSGIGEGAALALAEAGAMVAVPGDVAIEGDASKSVADTVAHFGRIDILINSAGVNEAGGIESLPLEQWHRVIDINLMGTTYTSRTAFPYMKARGSGHIVNISSPAGRRSGWQFASYSTSKFGVTGFTEALRQEGGKVGIRVANVEPGATATEIADSITDPKAREDIYQHTHKEGAMETSDIVDAIMLIVTLPPRANVTRILIQPTIDVAAMP